jgi:prepilin-type N-terminal cleavage/methylation domain-containing protein
MASDRKMTARGFTLIELLVVIALVGIITAIAIPSVHGIGRGSSLRAAVMELRSTAYLARQRAITKAEIVYIMFPSLPYLSPSGYNPKNVSFWNNLRCASRAFEPYRDYQLMTANLSCYTYIENVRRLPAGLVFDPAMGVAGGGTGPGIFADENRLIRSVNCGGAAEQYDGIKPWWFAQCPGPSLDGAQHFLAFMAGSGELVCEPSGGGGYGMRAKVQPVEVYICRGTSGTNAAGEVECLSSGTNGSVVTVHHAVGMPRFSDFAR